MPGSTLREQAGTSVRDPSSSTTQIRQTFTGVRFSRKQSVGVSMPRAAGGVEDRRALRGEDGFSIDRRSRSGAGHGAAGASGIGPRGTGIRGDGVSWLAHENRLQRLRADSSALEAVWPRPQMEASRIA